ncbi:hypothetical protein [uncultured Pontibacter sp.]|uniref:hypothetical protein n=1 Tax=uncultured Pontibacter sp. TaxID=453356 RepID=UPI00260ACF96|nr:hypothetical protein [uncultured Pontibacter sp.]
MNRRDRDRYDYDNYDRDYGSGAGYNRNDEHYHSARNLTNEFEQEYRSHHRGIDDDRYGRGSSRDDRRQSYHEGNMGDAYERMRDRRGSDRSDSSFQMNRGDRDMGNRTYENRYRSQGWSDSDSYGSSGRYSQRDNDYNRDMDSRDRFRSQGSSDRMGQGRSTRMSQDDLREGYGISDYSQMRQSEIRSSRGIPNAGITSSFEDDYGTDFDRDRNYGVSSGNFGGYGAQRGGYRRDRNDRY